MPFEKIPNNLWNGEEESLEAIRRFFEKGREWLKKRQEEGLAGAEFNRDHAALMDQVIRRLFHLSFGKQGNRQAATGFSLLAVGGYGREELSPFSDIDLLLLHHPGQVKDLEDRLRAFLHPLWDWGLTVGYTVQTPRDCRNAARKDPELFLSFLDARFLAGEKQMFLNWQEEFFRVLGPAEETQHILYVQERTAARHLNHGNSVFVLEPDVKDGKGGLRDYHAAHWALVLRYHAGRIEERSGKSFLSDREWRTYQGALGFLWRVRHQLHYLHGRREDRLAFEEQEAVALAFGFKGEDPQAATESFLKEYFKQTLHVYHLSRNLIENCLDENLNGPMDLEKKSAMEIIPGFFIYHGKLSLSDVSKFDRNPLNFWEAFSLIHEYGVEMDARLKENINAHLDYVGGRFRMDESGIRSFLSFFEKPGHLYRVLETMHETGFLRAFLPEFDRIHCHIQYDRYHIYPVDVHSFYTVSELEELENKTGRGGHLLSALMQEVEDPGLIKLSALIHDLGKGEGSSHAQQGEKIAASIGERLGLSSSRIETLRFLVREHLVYSETAQRRDLSDENLIYRFARNIGDPERLKMLYLLCFADLRAVGPGSWTAWKDTLMRELFLKTLHLLEKDGSLEKKAQEGMIKIQGEIMDLLQGQVSPPRTAEVLAGIPPRHYETHDARSIAQQILMAEKLSYQSVVLDGEAKPEEGCDELIVVVRDEPGLFAKISGVMTANFLNILSARISTWENGVAVDLFKVQSLIDEPFFQSSRLDKFQKDLQEVLEGRIGVVSLIEGMTPPLYHRYHPSRRNFKVEIDNWVSDFYTVVEVYSHDRPGLLWRITQKLYDLGLSIWSAQIATKVDQAVDIFYVQDLSGAKIEAKETTERIRDGILTVLKTS